ncbi:MAG: RsmE family RNA methyltransferase [Microthrixaceae bacterium]
MNNPAGVSPGSTGDSPWLQASTQVLVDDVSDPRLDDEALHHLFRVLRLRNGETVCASDGVGGWALCEFDGSKNLVTTGQDGLELPPEPRLSVGVALAKASKPEMVVQKLTELGIDRIVLFQARNSVARWDEAKVDRQIPRLRKIALEACAQSRRLHQPLVEFGDLGTLLGGHGTDGRRDDGDCNDGNVGAGVVLADAGGRPIRSTDTVVLIGPEGGWDPSEVTLGERISLGPTILRAETAAIAAATQMAALRAGLLGESSQCHREC